MASVRVVARLGRRLQRSLRAHPTARALRPVWRYALRSWYRWRARRTDAAAGVRKPKISIAQVPKPGLTIAGYFAAEVGVGEAARRILLGIQHAGIPHSTVEYRRTPSRQGHPIELSELNQAHYDFNIICVNADQLPSFAADVGERFFRDRRSAGVWFWEVSQFPAAYQRAFDYVDEVWAASEFVRDAIAAETTKPVRVVPLPVTAPAPSTIDRGSVGLAEGYTFLFNFDFLSVFARKNPLAVIDAYCRAFTPDDGAALIIKSINGHLDAHVHELGRLREATAMRPDITIRDGYLAASERDALVAASDCYVSLHRSEGFGLTMAEAMAHGKPVIATGYSGNLTFMDEGNSILVPYRLVPIAPGTGPYPPGVEWADPDPEFAAAAMRRLFDDRAGARALGETARASILERMSLTRCAAFLDERLQDGRRSSYGPQ